MVLIIQPEPLLVMTSSQALANSNAMVASKSDISSSCNNFQSLRDLVEQFLIQVHYNDERDYHFVSFLDHLAAGQSNVEIVLYHPTLWEEGSSREFLDLATAYFNRKGGFRGHLYTKVFQEVRRSNREIDQNWITRVENEDYLSSYYNNSKGRSDVTPYNNNVEDLFRLMRNVFSHVSNHATRVQLEARFYTLFPKFVVSVYDTLVERSDFCMEEQTFSWKSISALDR